MHALAGKAVARLGGLALLSAVAVNPWVGIYYQDYIENYYDVMLGYFWCSLGSGLLLVGLGTVAARRGREGWTNAAILAATLSLVVLADRALLVVFGLSYWIPDPAIGYRHRPESVRIRGSRLLPALDERLRGMRVVINRYGHHDDDFPQAKPPGQLRGLLLGDSVTMGDGVEKDDAIANQLEAILGAHGRGYDSYQIINTGVQGYSTNHEYAVFRESLVFAPNFVTVGLCLNDISDPAVFDAEMGGIGRFSGVFFPANAATGYLTNETGFSRLIAWALTPALTLEQRRLAQTYNVRAMVESPPDDERFRSGWRLVLDNLDRIYGLARGQGIEVALLIYPFTFQLFDQALQAPQRRLLAHAREQGIDAIDLTPAYEAAIHGDIGQILAGLGKANSLAREDVDLLRVFQAKRYFIDEDHPTPLGHRLAAGRLAEYLHRRGLVELDLPTFRRAQRRVLRHNPGEFTFRMPHSPQDVAQTAYILFLLDQELEKIRRIFDIGLKAATESEVRAQLYRALGEIERAMGYDEAAAATLRRAAQQ